jgi:hypothetical protein
MTFDSIPEDKEPSFPCACSGNIKERDNKWECDSCDWWWNIDDCNLISDLINAPSMNDEHEKITQMNENRRVGRFEISRKLIEDRPDIVRSIMGRCIVIRCETIYYTDAIEYTALSPDFNEVPEGRTIPRYVIEVSENGGATHIEFKYIDR